MPVTGRPREAQHGELGPPTCLPGPHFAELFPLALLTQPRKVSTLPAALKTPPCSGCSPCPPTPKSAVAPSDQIQGRRLFSLPCSADFSSGIFHPLPWDPSCTGSPKTTLYSFLGSSSLLVDPLVLGKLGYPRTSVLPTLAPAHPRQYLRSLS